VKISVKKAPPKVIKLQLEDGGQVQLEVESEWIPPLFQKCHSFGHVLVQCPTKANWIPKDNSADITLYASDRTDPGTIAEVPPARTDPGSSTSLPTDPPHSTLLRALTLIHMSLVCPMKKQEVPWRRILFILLNLILLMPH